MSGLARVLLIIAAVIGIVFCCLLILLPQVIVQAIIPQLPFGQGQAEQWAIGNYQDAGSADGHGTIGYTGGNEGYIKRMGYTGPDGTPSGSPFKIFEHRNCPAPNHICPVPILGCKFHDPNYTTHTGDDFPVAQGTPIYSTMGGQVIWASNNGPWGNLAAVENGNIVTYFAHLSGFSVNVGDVVTRGQELGLSGTTGNSTGPHLHYGVLVFKDAKAMYGSWENPEDFMTYGVDYIYGLCG